MTITHASDSQTADSESHAPGGSVSRREHLQHLVAHAAHLLPTQGPITVFVHHNTLHAFEHLPFEQAVRAAAKTLGCQPYLPEEQYREFLVSGRIRQDELATVLAEDLDEQADVLLGVCGTRYNLRLAMLQYPLRLAPSAELQWVVAETDALRRFRDDIPGTLRQRLIVETRHWVMRDLRNGGTDRAPRRAREDLHRVRSIVGELFSFFGKTSVERWDDATWESFCLHLLWRICLDGVRETATAPEARVLPVRHRDLMWEATGNDPDRLVNDLLIGFCAAFLDQGYANCQLPGRAQGFWRSFVALYGQAFGPPDSWLRGLPRELRRLDEVQADPWQSIEESLSLLGITPEEEEEFLVATLQALPGWAGMIWQMETNAEWTLLPAPRGTLVEYLAVRLILDRLALAFAARESLGWRDPLQTLRHELRSRVPQQRAASVEQQAFLVFQLAQALGWTPADLQRFSSPQWTMLLNELKSFSSFERRRIFHRAYERHYRNQTLDALANHSAQRRPHPHESGAAGRLSSAGDPVPSPSVPSFQIICCIDDREESFRRYLEELDPACETLSTAGFFAVAMYYRGAAEAHSRPLCPVVIKPQHYVREEVTCAFEKEHQLRKEARRVLGSASHRVHTGSRTILGGVLTALGGTLASIPMVTRILFPRMTAQFRKLVGRFVQPPPVTQLVLERVQADPGPEEGHLGYSLAEMTNIVERLLRDIGLTSNFAPLVILCGHGSSSLNNPHESAYNCGACSGGRGGPNARAFAQMANDRRVREQLKSRGLHIPESTHFIGSFHNTCDDNVTFFDLERLPPSLSLHWKHLCDVIDEARRRNAHERCRRFKSAPLNLTTDAALRHVEGRSEDLSQARPEYNHATDAVVLVGQRWWSRGLFMDRRAFLQSYDPRQDDEQQTILARILAAVIPVCAGISLEYYFSCVDTLTLGCGSKLPHNITSLLGVMEGAASDLRTGLSQQMTEIHEPMRILFVLETTPHAILSIMDRNPVIAQLVRNDWVQLATLDATTSRLQVYRNGRFEPYRPRTSSLPIVGSSIDWYRGWRDHLGYATIAEDNACTNVNAK